MIGLVRICLKRLCLSCLCLLGLTGALFAAGCASPVIDTAKNASSAEVPSSPVGPGDVVTVEVTATLEDGRLLYTTREGVARDPDRARMDGYRDPEAYRPEEVVAGKAAVVPGLASAVLDMVPGQSRTVTVPSEEAFGPADPSLRRELPCEKVFPVSLVLPAERYVQLTGGFPEVGRELHLSPYIQTRVAKVEESSVVLEMQAENGKEIEEPFGTVQILVEDQKILTRLTPKLGAEFMLEDRKGRIVATDGVSFTVDANPLTIGKALVLDLEVLSRVPAGTYDEKIIVWGEEFDSGLKRARQENKPAVLVLYADWCSWCKRLLGESVEDPRVKSLQDRFVWLKINSDVEKQFKEKFGQENYPMVVYLNPDGEVLQKAEGFKDGNILYRELRALAETEMP
ncbi:MAG: thioredoxin family protein [Syntrophotaleaceae bacterium]